MDNSIKRNYTTQVIIRESCEIDPTVQQNQSVDTQIYQIKE